MTDIAQRAADAGFMHGFVIATRGSDRHRERRHRVGEPRLMTRLPRVDEPIARIAPRLRQRIADEIEQHDLLHPATAECIERGYRANDRTRTQCGAPAHLVRQLLVAWARPARLIDYHDHRLADPLEDRQLRREVAR